MIKFTSKSAPSVTMFDRDAKSLIAMMGHSGSVPGALAAQDIGEALSSLKKALSAASQIEEKPVSSDAFADDDDDAPPPINVRAYPLLQLLEAAETAQQSIMWEQDNSVF